jgi:hypothetical protein
MPVASNGHRRPTREQRAAINSRGATIVDLLVFDLPAGFRVITYTSVAAKCDARDGYTENRIAVYPTRTAAVAMSDLTRGLNWA